MLSKIGIHKKKLPKKHRKRVLYQFLDMNVSNLLGEVDTTSLSVAIGSMLEDFNMVSSIPLDPTDVDSFAVLLRHIDMPIQYGEDVEPTEPRDQGADD